MEEGEGGGLFPKPGHKTLPRRKIRSPPQVQTREEEKEGELRGGGGKGERREGEEINNMLVSINLASI